MFKSKFPRHFLNLGKYKRIYRRHRDFCMTGEKTFVDNLSLIDYWFAKYDLSGGSIVECGTWRGGMSFGMIDLCPEIGEFHCFDSFEGLPEPGAADGAAAIAMQASDALVAGTNRADIEDFMAGLRRFDAATQRKVSVHKGWFEDTLRDFRTTRPISVLRLDGDWYESIMTSLDALYDQVQSNGLIIIDDYMTWDGCSRAVHDFLSKRQARDRIQQTWIGRVNYMVKDYPPEKKTVGGSA